MLLLVATLAGCLVGPAQVPLDFVPPADPSRPEWDDPPRVDWRYEPPNDRLDGSPYGVHLSFLDDSRSTMTVTWFTHGAAPVAPAVLWGPHPERLEGRVAAESRPVFGVEAVALWATIEDLAPGEWFYYRVTGSTGESQVFATRPAPALEDGFRFVLFGDHGTESESWNVTGEILARRPDLLVLAGDVSYADGKEQAVWDEYFHRHEPLFARVPLMAAPGNHEFKDGFFYDAYRSRFSLPNEGLWYGFDFLNVRFTLVEFHSGSAALWHLGDQFDFFAEELAATEGRKAAGEIAFHAVVQHYPLYSNHRTRGPHYAFNVELQEELVLTHGVDLMLVAHEHLYERSHPMARGTPTAIGTRDYENVTGYIQVTSGGGGRPLGSLLPPHRTQSWQAAGVERHHFVEFRVAGDHLQAWTWAGDGTGELLDRFSLVSRAAVVFPAPEGAELPAPPL